MHANTHVRTRASKHARTGVTNAFFVLLITMAIFAVFGIEMFHTSDDLDCAEQFRNFGKAMYTLFVVATGDGWSADVTLPCATNHPMA